MSLQEPRWSCQAPRIVVAREFVSVVVYATVMTVVFVKVADSTGQTDTEEYALCL